MMLEGPCVECRVRCWAARVLGIECSRLRVGAVTKESVELDRETCETLRFGLFVELRDEADRIWGFPGDDGADAGSSRCDISSIDCWVEVGVGGNFLLRSRAGSGGRICLQISLLSPSDSWKWSALA